ncbi:MAG: hypothetical protein AAFY46_04795 [Planctomycetota bacterium]
MTDVMHDLMSKADEFAQAWRKEGVIQDFFVARSGDNARFEHLDLHVLASDGEAFVRLDIQCREEVSQLSLRLETEKVIERNTERPGMSMFLRCYQPDQSDLFHAEKALASNDRPGDQRRAV